MSSQSSPMGLFERYLSLWVLLCIVAGTLLGLYLPAAAQTIGALDVAQVNIPVGLLIWVMIIPMLMKIDFAALHEVRREKAGIGITLFVNWVIKPFSMALLGWLFIKVLFADWLPAGMPRSISSMIRAGSSVRGLSEVITTTSLRRAATMPINGRLLRSRSPPQPNTQINLAWLCARRVFSACCSASGVWA